MPGMRGSLMADDAFDFEKLHTRYRPKIHRYLCRLAGENEAEDLCQEVFVKVERNLASFRNEAQLSTWLYRIATNSFYDRLRSPTFKQKSKEHPIEIDENTLEERVCFTRFVRPSDVSRLLRDKSENGKKAASPCSGFHVERHERGPIQRVPF